ncbi:MAG: amino acid adenylation domain-containing protein, partial [bacterium]|nr:amino acid adenylation domain-containing protein [bacterium]
VERTPDGIALIGHCCGSRESVTLTYRELDKKSRQLACILRSKGVGAESIVALPVERSIELLIGIMGILKAGGAYLPIASLCPGKRIKFMLADCCVNTIVGVGPLSGQVWDGYQCLDLNALNADDAGAELLLQTPGEPLSSAVHPAYIIYTSGSTGNPKGIVTSHYNAVRVVRDSNYIHFSHRDRVLQLSSHAFDGSIFDIFGALLNGAALVLLPPGETQVDLLARTLIKEQLTVFFVTTALFNLLVDESPGFLKRIRKVLFGGELVSPAHCRRALQHAGKGKIIHVYGPTETTVYATYYSVDAIEKNRDTIPIGSPLANTAVYVLDKYLKPVPFGVTGELYIGGEGTAGGYLNNPELTAQKFIKNPFLAGDSLPPNSRATLAQGRGYGNSADILYKTDDLCRRLADGNIEFIGRTDHQVKIRGFRIELGEIENRLLHYDKIGEAAVLVRRDKNENKYLCAYIVSTQNGKEGQGNASIDYAEVKRFLGQKLPSYMFPSFFVEMETMPLTANGKLNRKVLPEPEIVAGEGYTAPGNAMEHRLAAIWADVLAINKEAISSDGDFFQLGGHSLKAALLVSRIHKELNVRVQPAAVFENPTIGELARHIKTLGICLHEAIEPVEKKEYYELSSAQKRLYIMQQMDPRATGYNMPGTVSLPDGFDTKRLEDTFRQLIRRHAAFRTSFVIINQQPFQRVHEQVTFAVEYPGKGEPFIRPFDLAAAPLFRAALVEKNEAGQKQKYALMLDMHHIISDGVSREILVKEFITLYEGKKTQPLLLQYTDFSQWQNRLLLSKDMEYQRKYWLKRFEDEVPGLGLQTDYPRPAKMSYDGDGVDFLIDRQLNDKLKALMKETGTTPYMVLLAAYYLLLSKHSGREDIVVGSPITGRSHIDLQHIIGMFVNMLALRNVPTKEKTFRHFLQEVKGNTLDAFENQDFQFEELVEKLGLQGNVGRNPLFDTVFQLNNMEKVEMKLEGTLMPADELKIEKCQFDLILDAEESGAEIRMNLAFAVALFKRKTVERLTERYIEILEQVADNADLKLKDITISHDRLEIKTNISLDDDFGF